MPDVTLYRVSDGIATQIPGAPIPLEKDLQRLVEHNMETLLGARFLATEYSTGKKHGGRIDSLGIDENHCPVIVEYKRKAHQNVITQGLFYLDWMLDHRAEIAQLVRKRLGGDAEDALDWSNPRLICLASGFSRYDRHAVTQIDRAIDLVTYQDHGGDLLTLELVHAAREGAARTSQIVSSTYGDGADAAPVASRPSRPYRSTRERTVSDFLEKASPNLTALFDEVDSHALSLGVEVVKKINKNYFAYRTLRNFACVEVHPQSEKLLIYTKNDPDSLDLEPGFTRDVRSIGHFGTGGLEITLDDPRRLPDALDLIGRSYEAV